MLTANEDIEGRVENQWVKLCSFLGLGHSAVERRHMQNLPCHEKSKSWVESVLLELGRRLF